MKFKRANVNIALLKYWGKKDQKLNLPYQTSVSVTADLFYTRTNVTLDKNLKKDKVILDDKELTGLQYTRVVHHLNTMREYFKRDEHCVVTSINNVFIRAGYASSASGFAALTAAYIDAIGAKVSAKEMSCLARLGSGSATRSIHGGFVVWHQGESHETSFAEQIPIDWPEFRMLFTIIDSGAKRISSRIGMQITVEKAPSYDIYVRESNALVEPMIEGLKKYEIDTVGRIAERSAELMRNVMLEAGIEYHTPTTQKLIQKVRSMRSKHRIPVFYTFDAGPNLIILTLEKHVEQIIKLLPDVKIQVSGVGGGISDADL
ncbi:MAG: diphosphomevalonate decarboxylase [Bacilli bacterium]|jgi:diphosphomevalonate decarboxylase